MTVASLFLPNSVGAWFFDEGSVVTKQDRRRAILKEPEPEFLPEVLNDVLYPSGAIFAGSTPYVCSDIADIYTKFTGNVTSCFSTLSEALELAECVDTPRFILVDVDCFPLESAIGRLFDFRAVHPSHVVILLSHDFSNDDVSTSRKSIADASLKLPLGRKRLLYGMGFACRNNKFTMRY